ncbi:MAG: oligosaccharide flippase family protein [Rhizomicrobium sp.]
MAAASLRRNTVWNLAEVAASSLVLFVLYRLILDRLGVTALGIWSLVLATISFARFADLGAASSLGRYVALAQAKGEDEHGALLYVETALITNALLYLSLGLILYWPAWWALGLVTDGVATEQARELLPFAVGVFVLQNVASVLTSALIGFHLSYQKSMLMLVALAIQAAVALTTIGSLGLRGVALAQIAQYLLLLVFGWCLAIRASTGKFRFALPHRMGLKPLRDLIGFGLRLQALNLALFLYDPATKFVLTATLGLATLGIYEAASRGIQQVRQLVTAPSQNLTPLFTAELHTNPSGVHVIYERSFVAIFLASAASMGAMSIGSPVISFIWFGQFNPIFVVFSVILAAGWFVNMITVPAFHLGIAAARIRWNIMGCAVISLLGPASAYLLAGSFGAPGGAVGIMSAVIAGSLITAIMNVKDAKIKFLPPLGRFRGTTRQLLRIGS